MFDLSTFFNEFPDVDELKPFDGFFVGEGSSKVLSKVSVTNYYEQLYNHKEESESIDITDWEDFGGEFRKVEDYEEVFFEAKKRVYDLVGYVSKKLSESKSKLVRVKDLVVTSVDKRLIDYLRYSIEDYNTVYSIAELSALKELGYVDARFRAKDTCPICLAMDKVVVNIQSVLDKLSQGNYIAHKYCECRFEPFGKYYGVCDILEEGIEVVGCPIEWKTEIVSKLKELGYDFAVFGNAEKYMRYDGADFGVGTLSFEINKGDKKGIFIDKSFIGFFNALDYMDVAKFNRCADFLIGEGIDYIDPKDLKGELYIKKNDDGTELRIISYHNPVTGKYEFRDADTGELALEME